MILLSSLIFSISSKNWIMIWLFLEANSFSFIMLMNMMLKSEAVLKYFMIQSFSSSILLISLSLKVTISLNNNFDNMVMTLVMMTSLMIKSGMVPFHMWMMELVMKMKWTVLFVFLSIQKLPPIYILAKVINSSFILTSAILSSFIGAISQLTTADTKNLMVFSSITHLGWMIFSFIQNNKLFMMYFLFYFINLAILTHQISKMNVKSLLNKTKNNNLILAILSYSGVPPLMGFMAKWIVINENMKNENFIFPTMLFTMMSVLSMYAFLRFANSKILNMSEKSKNTESNYNSSSSFILMMTTPSIMVFLNFL